MYLNISTGELSRYEDNCIIASIGEMNLHKDGVVDDFIDLVSKKLLEVHYTIDSEAGDNTEFLLHVSKNIEAMEHTVVYTVNDYTRFITINGYSEGVIINDAGYLQLRVNSHLLLTSLLLGYEACKYENRD